MANQVLRLWVDTARKVLVESSTSRVSPPQLTFVQGDTVTLVITLLEPNTTGGISSPYSKVNVSGLTCKVGIGTPTATTGSTAPGIFQNTFATDTVNNTLTGALYVTPSSVATLLGTSTTGTSTLEIEIYEDSNYTTVLSANVTVKAELIEAATTPPTADDVYNTSLETAATYVKKIGAAGDTITLTSPDGTKQVVIWIDDDGVLHQDATTV